MAALQGQIVGTSDPTSVFARTDFLLDAKNTLNVQFDFNRVHATDVDEASTRSIAPLASSASLNGESYWVRGSLTTLIGSSKVNHFLAQWAQDQRRYIPNSSTPEAVINGFGVLGGNSLANQSYTSNINRINDDFAITRGGAIFHFGVGFACDPASEQHEANLNGRFDFDSLTAYLNNSPRRYQQTFIVGNAMYNGSVRQLSFYTNARLPLTKNLTLTAGLRWDGQWNPQPTRPNLAIPQTVFIPNDLSQWQPRLGLAWNPVPNAVVRLSAGFYDAPTPATFFQRVFTDNGLNTVVADSYYDPQVLALVSGGRALLTPPAGLIVPAAFVVGIAPSFRNPRSFQASGSVEQQIHSKVTLSAGYVLNSTWNLQQMVNQNLFPPTYDASGMPIFPATRPNGDIGQLLVNESSAHSSYDGLLVTSSFQLPHIVLSCRQTTPSP